MGVGVKKVMAGGSVDRPLRATIFAGDERINLPFFSFSPPFSPLPFSTSSLTGHSPGALERVNNFSS